ncbi:Importin 9 [Geranomyces variabilis]|uniref:Importin 9 n=1 Tax=Geranomyces variabilis TaxID=109894 RepID=A0AAD5XQB1_9FUNG|nr:Importin 9 [Geranomyces variabilis]
MEAVVFETLAACLSPDPAIRRAAEFRGSELAKQHPEYAQWLTHIAVTPSYPLSERQLAAVSLKLYVETHWQARSDELVSVADTPEEVKRHIRASILKGISDPIKQIRVLIAYVVAKIAHFDWPEAWPNLFEVILEGLRGDPERVHGVMRVLAEFMRDDLTDQHFEYFAPALLPELLRIFSNANDYRPRDRARALGVFRDFTAILYFVSEEHPQSVLNYLDPVLPSWMEAFLKILSTPNISTDLLPVKHEVLRTLCNLIKQFPKSMSAYTPRFVEPIWQHLLHFQDKYLCELVNVSQDYHRTEDVDSDGEVLGFESLLYSLLEFMKLVAKKKAFRHLFSLKNTPGQVVANLLPDLVAVCLTYFQITADLEEAWTNDMNQYILDDEEEALNYSVRIAVEELLMGRALWFASQFADALSPTLKSQYLGAAVQALGPTVENAAVKISAVKALMAFCAIVESSSLIPYQAVMIEGIVGLSNTASDEALCLLLEALSLVAKVNEEVAARYVEPITTLLLKVWEQGAEEPTEYTSVPFPVKALKLLLIELQHQTDSQLGRPTMRGTPDFDDDEITDKSWLSGDEEEDDEWEDAVAKDTFLQGVLDRGPDELDPGGYDDTDSELLKDPLYQVDLKAYLTGFLANIARTEPHLLQQLSDAEARTLHALIGQSQ